MLKIYGRSNSVNVMKALWACGELGLRFERTDVGGPFGGNRDAWYLSLNPNAVIPTIDDDGFVLWESNVIVRYLAAKHDPGGLWPADAAARADADRWMDWQQTRLNGSVFPRQLIRTLPEQRDPVATEAARQACIEAFAVADAILARRIFIGGDAFTMGDIPLGACLHRWMALPVERPAMPHLDRYYQRLSSRPAYREHVQTPLS